MVSDRAHVGWSTKGHSAIDVHIYSSGGPGTEKLRGNVENTDGMTVQSVSASNSVPPNTLDQKVLTPRQLANSCASI